ncbi:MAG TPA: hypothetical protein DEB39_10615, partial [Planctomycetaceae bacterium]|nr:hypothetical protein [Planctomycetaceae bacterium]
MTVFVLAFNATEGASGNSLPESLISLGFFPVIFVSIFACHPLVRLTGLLRYSVGHRWLLVCLSLLHPFFLLIIVCVVQSQAKARLKNAAVRHDPFAPSKLPLPDKLFPPDVEKAPDVPPVPEPSPRRWDRFNIHVIGITLWGLIFVFLTCIGVLVNNHFGATIIATLAPDRMDYITAFDGTIIHPVFPLFTGAISLPGALIGLLIVILYLTFKFNLAELLRRAINRDPESLTPDECPAVLPGLLVIAPPMLIFVSPYWFTPKDWLILFYGYGSFFFLPIALLAFMIIVLTTYTLRENAGIIASEKPVRWTSPALICMTLVYMAELAFVCFSPFHSEYDFALHNDLFRLRLRANVSLMFGYPVDYDDLLRVATISNVSGRKIVHYLVDNGADINRKNDFDAKTPLENAIQNASFDVVLTLIQRGANFDENTVDKDGKTYLHNAAMHNRDVAVLKYLV